jgi:L-rhamnose mutarotase
MQHRYCLALDLIDDESLIAEYEQWHRAVWPEIVESIRNSGIEQMQIYRVANRLFMIMDVNDDFSFEAKARADRNDAKVQEWE